MKRWFINRWLLLFLLIIFIGATLERNHLVGSKPILFLLLIFPVVALIIELLLIHHEKDNDVYWGALQYLTYAVYVGCAILAWVFAGYIAIVLYVIETIIVWKIVEKKKNPPWINPAV